MKCTVYISNENDYGRVYTWKILQGPEFTCDTKPFSGFDLLHFYESVFHLIMESLSEAIKRKLSNRVQNGKNKGSRWKYDM